MKINKKSTIERLIFENQIKSIEVKEMAVRPQAVSRPITISDDTKKIAIGLTKERFHKTNIKDGFTLIGHDVRVDPNDMNSERMALIFTCAIDDFIEQFPDIKQQILNYEEVSFPEHKITQVKYVEEVCPKWIHKTINKKSYTAHPYRDKGESNVDDAPIQTKIHTPTKTGTNVGELVRRKLNPILKKGLMEDEDFNKALKIRTLPKIVFNEREFEDRHGNIADENRFVYTAHYLETYRSSEDFLNTVMNNIKSFKRNIELPKQEDTTPLELKYLRRRYNKVYDNYEADRKNQREYRGKTKIYKLDKQGYAEPNLDVSQLGELTIKGILEEETKEFTWQISYIVFFGKKPTEAYRIKNGLNTYTFNITSHLNGGEEDKMTVSKSINMRNVENYSAEHQQPFIVYPEIIDLLIETINEFKNGIMSIDPRNALKIANMSADVSINENKTIIKLTQKDLTNIITEVLKTIS